MNEPACPACGFTKNPPGSAFCVACSQGLVHPTVQNFLKAVDRKRQQEKNSAPSLFRILQQTATRHARGLQWVLGGTAALGALLAGSHFLISYNDPLSRFNRQGSSLDYALPATVLSYLAGVDVEAKIWSERDGRMDTPVMDLGIHETGTLRVEKAPGAGMEHSLLVQAQEWIKNQATPGEVGTATVPPNHPSLAPGKIMVDPEGTVVGRENAGSARVGRCLPLLMPAWPKGIHRRGDRWNEPIEWWEMIGPWKIHWTAQLLWHLDGYAACGNSSCAELSCQGHLQPEVLALPGWANGALGRPQFSGQVHGDVRFSVTEAQLVSNLFQYEGNFLFPLSDLSRIPIELRVGREVEAEPGTLVMHLKETLDLRKP